MTDLVPLSMAGRYKIAKVMGDLNGYKTNLMSYKIIYLLLNRYIYDLRNGLVE